MNTQGPCEEAGGPGSVGVALDEDEDFESFLDLPYISLARLGSEVTANLVIDVDDGTTAARVALALNEASERGYSLAGMGASPEESMMTLHFRPTGGTND